LASDFDLWQNIVEVCGAGVCVNPQDVVKIRSSIVKMLQANDELSQMGARGQVAIDTKLNWGIEEKKLFSLYEDIMK
jgi:hypothetical protein